MNADIALAFLIDCLIGDPVWITHPVVIVGRAVTALEKILRQFCRNKNWERSMGIVLTTVVVTGSYLVCRLITGIATFIDPVIGRIVSIWMISTTIAARGLSKAAFEVFTPLDAGDLELARNKLSLIVGRDTADLPPNEIARGAIETVAENTCDGVVAPLIFAFIGGAPLAMAYKAINTLDSMVGYKDERYLDFGRASAKLDDAANYLPARISGSLLVIAALLCGFDWKRALRTVLSEGRNHPSPNSGISEAAVAGALGLRLGGVNRYGGAPSFRGYIGQTLGIPAAGHIPKAVLIMWAAAILAVVLGTTVRTIAG